MKSYPTIPTKPPFDLPVYVFDKLDGSNIRAEWSKKKGFYKFGTRTRLVDDSDPLFGTTPELIVDKYEDDITKIANDMRWGSAVFFFEFFGPNSGFGLHVDEDHDVVLIDVSVYKKGMLDPKSFINTFSNVDTAAMLYSGNCTSDFISHVREGILPGMTFEGVVCKMKHPKLGVSVGFKIKTLNWLHTLKQHCAGDEEMFEKLQ